MDKNLVLSLVLAAIWTIPWKGVALWKAARRYEEIKAGSTTVYIFIFSKREKYGRY